MPEPTRNTVYTHNDYEAYRSLIESLKSDSRKVNELSFSEEGRKLFRGGVSSLSLSHLNLSIARAEGTKTDLTELQRARLDFLARHSHSNLWNRYRESYEKLKKNDVETKKTAASPLAQTPKPLDIKTMNSALTNLTLGVNFDVQESTEWTWSNVPQKFDSEERKVLYSVINTIPVEKVIRGTSDRKLRTKALFYLVSGVQTSSTPTNITILDFIIRHQEILKADRNAFPNFLRLVEAKNWKRAPKIKRYRPVHFDQVPKISLVEITRLQRLNDKLKKYVETDGVLNKEMKLNIDKVESYLKRWEKFCLDNKKGARKGYRFSNNEMAKLNWLLNFLWTNLKEEKDKKDFRQSVQVMRYSIRKNREEKAVSFNPAIPLSEVQDQTLQSTHKSKLEFNESTYQRLLEVTESLEKNPQDLLKAQQVMTLLLALLTQEPSSLVMEQKHLEAIIAGSGAEDLIRKYFTNDQGKRLIEVSQLRALMARAKHKVSPHLMRKPEDRAN